MNPPVLDISTNPSINKPINPPPIKTPKNDPAPKLIEIHKSEESIQTIAWKKRSQKMTLCLKESSSTNLESNYQTCTTSETKAYLFLLK